MGNYAKIATQIRKTVLDMIYRGQSSHIGSNFSCIDLLTVIYETKQPNDKVIFSKGWAAASAYAFALKNGLCTKRDLDSYCRADSKFIGLLEPGVAGIECAGGSMGYGLPFGAGFALAKKLKGETGKVFVLMGDGEVAIGTTWESALLACQHHLDNLVVVIDYNGLQAMGKTNEILNIEPLTDKWQAFGWDVCCINGHDYQDIEHALSFRKPGPAKPMVIIAETVKGKGVSFMENNNLYHYKNLSKQEYEAASKELGSRQPQGVCPDID